MRKLCAILIPTLTAIWLLGTAVQLAHAKIGIATGFNFGISNPFTPHIGPVYWTPGDKNGVFGYAAATGGPTELDQFIKTLKREEQRAACAKNFAGYFSRHGVTTPRPLKGFHGCKKYALDNSYWKQRRGQPVVHVPHVQTTSEIAVHNMFIPWK